jgi:hypothetical protein
MSGRGTVVRIGIGIAILWIAAGASAQDVQTVLFGQNWLNGRGWQLLDSNSKALYLTAFGEGSGLALINMLTTGKPKPTTEEFNRQLSYFISDGAFTVVDTCEQIDKFYALPDNLDIPVAYAALYVNAKFRGDTPQELESYSIRLKKMVREKAGHMAPTLKVR